MLFKSYEEHIKQSLQGVLNTIFFGVIFAGTPLKFDKS